MADDISLIIGVDSTPVKRAVQLLNNLESEFKDVKRAEEKGLITRKRAAVETKRLTDEMARLRRVSNGSAASFKKFDKALSGSGKSARRNEIAFQQAGYQVQDFIVQVQAGTNPLIAFSQQGSQLAGFFAGPWGAMIGLGIAALSSLGMAFMATREQAKDFKDQIEDTESALDEYFALLSSKSGIYDDVFEKNIAALKLTSETAKDLLAIAKIEAFESIDGLAQSLADANTEAGFLRKLMLGTDIGLVGDLLGIETLMKGKKSTFVEARKQVKAFISDVRGISEASDIDTMYEFALAARDAFKQNVDITGKMTEQQKQFFTQLTQTIQQLEIMGASTEALESSWSDTTMATEAAVEATLHYYDTLEAAKEAVKEREDAVKEILDTVEAEKKSMTDTLELNRLILKGGKDSLKVREKEAEIAREQYRLDKISEGIKGNHLKVAMALYDENAKVTAEIASSEDKAKGLADALKDAASAMSSLLSFGQGLDKAIAVATAKVKALEAGTSGAVAGRIAGYRADLAAKLGDPALGMEDKKSVSASYNRKIDELQTLLTREQGLRDKNKSSGSNVVNIKEIIAARELQMQQERSLIGLSEKQAAGQRVYYDLLKKNKDADVQLTEAEIEGAAKSIAAFEEQNRVLQEAVDKQEEIADTIASSMGDAFMSIVDGTKSAKDAFKDMAREIIKRLYEILVVEELVQSISGTIKGAFSGGLAPSSSSRPQIRPFADGGVLSGPTMFPMAGGKTGLMGEAGPEAIMPLKRGANGKLGVQMEGGAGSTTVVQNFNFQANGDDSVKRIIAQAAPQIANMTKKSMLDDRRRGGQMKATFG